MPKKKPKRKQQPLRTEYIQRATSDELGKALREKLTVAELATLESQIRKSIGIAVDEAAKKATEEAYTRQYAVTMRVLRDRFGFGKKRLNRLWSASLDYIRDMDSGLIDVKDMLSTLEHEDKIKLAWRVILK